MERLMIFAFALTCTTSTINCEELKADFDMSTDGAQIVNLGFVSERQIIEDECKLVAPPAWCPKVENSDVKFASFPESVKKFTFSADRTFQIAVKKQNPPTKLSTVNFACDKDHAVDQEVNAGFKIENAVQMCPKVIDPNEVITCEISHGDATMMKVTFGGVCKAEQDFTFTGKNGKDEKIEMKVKFTTVNTEAPVPPPAVLTTTTTTTTSKTVKTEKSTIIIGTDTSIRSEIEKETTTTSDGAMLKFPTRLLPLVFFAKFILKVVFFR